MTGSSVKYWLLLACLLITVYGSFLVWRRDSTATVDHAAVAAPATQDETSPAPPPVADFTLTDQSGRPFDSASLEGQVWVGSFFFTNCPGACWRMNRALAEWQETNPASDTRFISITCDPDDDTPAALTKYAEHFQADPARWTFLTGDMALIRRIGNDLFHVAVENETHSDRAFIVDRNGEVRGRFRLTEPSQLEMFKKQLAQVEAEPPPADRASPGDGGRQTDRAGEEEPAGDGLPVEAAVDQAT